MVLAFRSFSKWRWPSTASVGLSQVVLAFRVPVLADVWAFSASVWLFQIVLGFSSRCWLFVGSVGFRSEFFASAASVGLP